MRSMDVHFGVIRDREGIYSTLLQSQSMNQQLAVCFSEDGKLLVKICSVTSVSGSKEGVVVVLKCPADEDDRETVLNLDRIQSIYPIREFI